MSDTQPTVTELMQQMRDWGHSEEDIFKAVMKRPDLVARYKAERASSDFDRSEQLRSRKLPGGMEDLTGQAKALTESAAPTVWGSLKDAAKGTASDIEAIPGVKTAAAMVGAGTNAATMGLSNWALNAVDPSSTAGQGELHPFLRGTAEGVGGMFNPANRMAGAIGGVVTRALTSGLPTAAGAGQAVGRFLGNVAGRGVGGAITGGLAQASQEGMDGFQPGMRARIGSAAGIGAGLGVAGAVGGQAGERIQNTRGARARRYAATGVEEAKRVLADPESNWKDRAEAARIVGFPQSGDAAYEGMNLENDRAHPLVKPAYDLADRTAAADKAKFNKLREAAERDAAGNVALQRLKFAQAHRSALGGSPGDVEQAVRQGAMANSSPVPEDAIQGRLRDMWRQADEAVAEQRPDLKGINARKDSYVASVAKERLVDARPLFDEMANARPAARAELAKFAADLEGKVFRGPNGEMFVPADALNRTQKDISGKGAWANVPGVVASDIAPADAVARRLNSKLYGDANEKYGRQEMAREDARKAMGLNRAPSVGAEESDQVKLERLMQPGWHGHGYGPAYNLINNAQVISGTAPVQGAARAMAAAGNAASMPSAGQAQAATSMAQQMQHAMAAQRERYAGILNGIFGKKKKEQDDGVRQ